MRNTILLILILISSFAEAQFIKEKSINIQIGYGASSPYNSVGEIINNGFFVQGELVLKVNSWVDLRPYAGLITTSSDGKDIMIMKLKKKPNQKLCC